MAWSSRRGSEWRAYREQLLLKAGYRCARCRSIKSRLEIHHKVPLHKGGGDSLSNVEVLCTGCHVKHHKEEAQLFQEERRNTLKHTSVDPTRNEWRELINAV